MLNNTQYDTVIITMRCDINLKQLARNVYLSVG